MIYRFNPLQDPRWSEFSEAHSKACVFHTMGWLKTLHATYGYEPVVFTTSAPGATLTNGILFCEVKSWITGKRLVSLPFTDHCEPLCEDPGDMHSILECVAQESKRNGSGYVEIRPLSGDYSDKAGLCVDQEYRIHLLDLRPEPNSIFAAFDKSSVQRRLRHAEKEALTYEEGTSTELLEKFYKLLIRTRRRHSVPPQPIAWFRNMLAMCEGKAKIYVASHCNVAVASILTLSHNGTVIYKYGCSDERYHKYAGTVSLFWRAIRDAKESGAHTFDMGRSETDNPGLIRFKSNFGAENLALSYWRSPQAPRETNALWNRMKGSGANIVAHLPDSMLIALGRVLYRHAG